LELQAFLSRRVVTPEGIRPAAILVEGEKIQSVVSFDQVPKNFDKRDFGNAAAAWPKSRLSKFFGT